jgi:hypothetical protein
MNYTATKIDGQKLMFCIKTTLDDKEIEFNVVCGKDESELDELVEHHLNYLQSPPKTIEAQAQTIDINAILQQQQAMIEELKAEIVAMKGQ